MSLIRLAIIIALIGVGVHYWKEYSTQKENAAFTSSEGFLSVPMPPNTPANTVVVFAPENCPKEGAQRARALVQHLKEQGISSVQTSRYEAQAVNPNPDTLASFKRLNTVMTGEIPIVLINGMGKANPSLNEVIAEYNRTK